MQSIARDMGLNPSYYLPDAEPLPEPPADSKANQLPPFFMDETPESTLAGQDIMQDVSANLDLGNG